MLEIPRFKNPRRSSKRKRSKILEIPRFKNPRQKNTKLEEKKKRKRSGRKILEIPRFRRILGKGIRTRRIEPLSRFFISIRYRLAISLSSPILLDWHIRVAVESRHGNHANGRARTRTRTRTGAPSLPSSRLEESTPYPSLSSVRTPSLSIADERW